MDKIKELPWHHPKRWETQQACDLDRSWITFFKNQKEYLTEFSKAINQPPFKISIAVLRIEEKQAK